MRTPKLETARKFEIPSEVGEHLIKLPAIFRLPRIYKNTAGRVYVIADIKVGVPEEKNAFLIQPEGKVLPDWYHGKCIGSFQKENLLFFVYRKLISEKRKDKVVKFKSTTVA